MRWLAITLLVLSADFLNLEEGGWYPAGIPIPRRNMHAYSVTSLANLTTVCRSTSTKKYSWYMQVVTPFVMHLDVNPVWYLAFLPINFEVPASATLIPLSYVAGVQQTKSGVLLLLNKWYTLQLSVVQVIASAMPCPLLVSQLVPETLMRTCLRHVSTNEIIWDFKQLVE